MRITNVSNYNFTIQKKQVKNTGQIFPASNEIQVCAMTAIPASYFVSFKGYHENVELIETLQNSLNETVANAVSELVDKYENPYNNRFLEYLESLKDDQGLYNAITRDSKTFNRIAKKFDEFNYITLYSLDSVKRGWKIYSEYWEENSKIGNNKTIDIIKRFSENKNADANAIIKNTTPEEYENIKNAIVREWFKNEAFNSESVDVQEVIKRNIEILKNDLFKKNTGEQNRLNKIERRYKSVPDSNEIMRRSDEQVLSYCNKLETAMRTEFYNSTLGKIIKNNVSKDQKLEALNTLLSYVGEKLLEDKDEELSEDFIEIENIQKGLKKAKEKEQLLVNDAIKRLYSFAVKQWEKDNIPKALNDALEKAIYVVNAEMLYPKVNSLQNYPNFNIDEKYFVLKYFNERYNFSNIKDKDKDDYLYKIINDRENIEEPKIVIPNIVKNLEQNKSVYFNHIDKFYDILACKKYDNEVQIPERVVMSPNDNLSYVDLYIDKMGKTRDLKNLIPEEKIEYLESLTLDEMKLLNEKIKEDWVKENQKYEILAEISRQAKRTSVFLDMNETLKKINVNIDNVRIQTKLDSVSLRNVLENRAILADSVNEDTVSKLLLQNTELERAYNSATPEQKKVMDEKFATMMPVMAQTLSQGQNDSALKAQLQSFAKIPASASPANHTFEQLKTFLMYRAVSRGITGTENFVKSITAARKAGLPMQEIPQGVDMIGDNTAGAAVGVATAGVAAKTGTVAKMTGTVGAAIVAHPVAAAVAGATLIAAATAIVCEGKAAKLEKGQRDLKFYVEI